MFWIISHLQRAASNISAVDGRHWLTSCQSLLGSYFEWMSRWKYFGFSSDAIYVIWIKKVFDFHTLELMRLTMKIARGGDRDKEKVSCQQCVTTAQQTFKDDNISWRLKRKPFFFFGSGAKEDVNTMEWYFQYNTMSEGVIVLLQILSCRWSLTLKLLLCSPAPQHQCVLFRLSLVHL